MQRRRYERALPWGQDLASELTLRDAEYARDEAFKLYLEYREKAMGEAMEAA